ncbi:MAG: response regulator [Clostridia bacterium]
MMRIMIVDDEKSIRSTMCEYLKGKGYEVLEAENVPKALNLLKEHPVDIVLTDIIMPGQSGLALLDAVNSMQKEVLVVIMTGDPSTDTAIAAIRSQAYDYLTKPVRFDELLQTMRKASKYIALKKENLIYQKQLEDMVMLRTKSLRKAMLDITSVVAAMLDLRDPYTAGHQRRVGELAGNIGVEMGLSDETVEGLRVIGYIHDIGKIQVPSEILTKPTALSPPEYEIIKLHCLRGYEVLKDVDLPWPAAEVIYQHHERLNGSGYPRGLKGDALLLETRILSVADVIEAMTTHRPYRAALSQDEALNEINHHSGILYDSQVVDVCTKLMLQKSRL